MEIDRDVVNVIHKVRWDVKINWGQAHAWLFCDADTPVDIDPFMADTGVEVPPQLRNFVRAVDSQMAGLPSESFMFGYPLHDPPRQPGEPRLGFVAMPYGPDWFDRVKASILAVGSKHGFDCKVSKDMGDAGRVPDQIWHQLRQAEAVVADLTGGNPNVYYEVGLAHAVGKQVICITQDAGDIPFDVRTVRQIIYDKDDLPTLEAELENAFRAAPRRYKFDT